MDSGTRPSLDDRGFIMVALLISIAVTAVWAAAAVPAWRQQVIREREAELIFRGESYARAIQLYRQKNNQNLPPNVDILVSQRYLRRRYKDPITGKDFLVVGGMGLQPGGTGTLTGPGGRPGAVPGTIGASGGAQGIIGVRSTSNDTSIRLYYDQQTYSQWQFDFTREQQKSGASLGPAAGPRGGAPGAGAGRLGGPTNQANPGGIRPMQPGAQGAPPRTGAPGPGPGPGGGPPGGAQAVGPGGR